VPLVSVTAVAFRNVSVSVTGVRRAALPLENAFDVLVPEDETVSVPVAAVAPGSPCALVRLAAGMVLVMEAGAVGETSTVTVTVHVLAAVADRASSKPRWCRR